MIFNPFTLEAIATKLISDMTTLLKKYYRLGDVTQLVKWLAHAHEALGLFPVPLIYTFGSFLKSQPF